MSHYVKTAEPPSPNALLGLQYGLNVKYNTLDAEDSVWYKASNPDQSYRNPLCFRVQGISERSLWEGEGAMGRVEVLGALRTWPNWAGSEAWPHVGLGSLPTSDLGALKGGPGPISGGWGRGCRKASSLYSWPSWKGAGLSTPFLLATASEPGSGLRSNRAVVCSTRGGAGQQR